MLTAVRDDLVRIGVLAVLGATACPMDEPDPRVLHSPIDDRAFDAPHEQARPAERFVDATTVPARPAVTRFVDAIAALRHGDDVPIRNALAVDLAWTMPLVASEPRARDDVVAALIGRRIAIRRVLDLGASAFAAELDLGGADALWILQVEGDAIPAVRSYGASPFGPDRDPIPSRSHADAPIVVTGRPHVGNVAVTRRLYDAVNARDDADVAAILDPQARHREIGPASDPTIDFATALRAALPGPDARVTVRQHFSLGAYVLVEAVIADGDPERSAGVLRPTSAFVDVLHLAAGRVLASTRYRNLRVEEDRAASSDSRAGARLSPEIPGP